MNKNGQPSPFQDYGDDWATKHVKTASQYVWLSCKI